MNNAYDKIDRQVTKLIGLGQTARQLDSAEIMMFLQNPVLAAIPNGASMAYGFIQTDAAAAMGRVHAAMIRVITAHGWLAQSRFSMEALQDAADTWATAHDHSAETLAEMDAMRRKGMEWTGGSAAGQVGRGAKQQVAQTQLVASSKRIVDGCNKARLVVSNLLAQAQMSVSIGLTLGMVQANRAPQFTTNMFALNGRMKALAHVLESLASSYETLKGGSGWQAASDSIAKIFVDNAEALSKMSSRNIPV